MMEITTVFPKVNYSMTFIIHSNRNEYNQQAKRGKFKDYYRNTISGKNFRFNGGDSR